MREPWLGEYAGVVFSKHRIAITFNAFIHPIEKETGQNLKYAYKPPGPTQNAANCEQSLHSHKNLTTVKNQVCLKILSIKLEVFEQRLTKRRLRRRKQKLLRFIAFDHPFHKTGTKRANTIKHNERAFPIPKVTS